MFELAELFTDSSLLVFLVGKNSFHLPLGVRCFPILKQSLIELKRSNGQRSTKPKNKIRYLFKEFLKPEKTK